MTYQRPRNEGIEAIAPKQLKDSLSATKANLEDSINEEQTAQSSRNQASSSKDRGIKTALKST